MAGEADLFRGVDQLDRAVPLQLGGRVGGHGANAAATAARDEVMAVPGAAVHVV